MRTTHWLKMIETETFSLLLPCMFMRFYQSNLGNRSIESCNVDKFKTSSCWGLRTWIKRLNEVLRGWAFVSDLMELKIKFNQITSSAFHFYYPTIKHLWTRRMSGNLRQDFNEYFEFINTHSHQKIYQFITGKYLRILFNDFSKIKRKEKRTEGSHFYYWLPSHWSLIL